MNTDRKSKLILLSVLIVALGSVFAFNMMKFSMEFRVSSIWIVLVSGIIALLVIKSNGINGISTIVIVAVLGGIWASVLPVYNPADEGGYFNVIEYLNENGHMPLITEKMDTSKLLDDVGKLNYTSTGTMYEAVHPPVYAMLMSLVTRWFSDSYIRFWICRYCGVLILVLIALVGSSFLKYCRKKDMLDSEDEKIYQLILVLLLCLPGVLTRFGTISNEGLAVLGVSLCLYQYIMLLFENVSVKRILLVSITSVLTILTKTTTAFIVVLLMIILLYLKKYKELVCCLFMEAVGIAPWLLYNYRNYHSLTGIKLHLDYVLPAINPTGRSIDIVEEMWRLLKFFFYPADGQRNNAVEGITWFGSLLFLSVFIIILFNALTSVWYYIKDKGVCFLYTLEEKKLFVNFVFCLCILGNVMILMLGTISTKVSVLGGRYLYLSVIPIVYLATINLRKIIKKKVIIAISTFMVSVMGIYNLLGYTANDELLKAVGNFKKKTVITSENVTVYDIEKDGQKFICGKIDPWISFKEDINNIDGIEITLGNYCTGNFKVYYKNNSNDEFCEENTIISQCNSNTNSIRFECRDICGVFRLSLPAESEFVVQEIKIYH